LSSIVLIALIAFITKSSFLLKTFFVKESYALKLSNLTAYLTKNIVAISNKLFKIEGQSLSFAEILSGFCPGGLSILNKAKAFA
jgi:hypothetical protein